MHGSKLLTGLRLGLSHLYEHAFSRHFQYTLNILCACGKDVESITFFSLHCTNLYISRQTLFQNIRSIGEQILSQSETDNSHFSYGNRNYNLAINRLITNSTNEYLISTGRFKCVLFNENAFVFNESVFFSLFSFFLL